MNKKAFSYAVLALLVTAAASAQAWRGQGRLQGYVVDQNDKPIKGAKVMLISVKGSNTGPEPILTDARGFWAAGGLIGGQWLIDISADGYLVRKTNANVSEIERLTKPMRIALEPKPEEKPVEPAREAIMVGGVEIAPEVAASIEAANGFMKEQKWKEAAAEYEKVIAVLSTNMQLKAALARAYYGAGEKTKAIASLKEVHAADTGNVVYATLLADMLLESGDVEGGQKVLAAIPPGGITDPNTAINIGIRFVNNNKPEEAHKYFNDAVGLDGTLAAAYYYRGIAALQLKKMNEAKVDLQKVVALGKAFDDHVATTCKTEANVTECKSRFVRDTTFDDAKELLAQMK